MVVRFSGTSCLIKVTHVSVADVINITCVDAPKDVNGDNKKLTYRLKQITTNERSKETTNSQPIILSARFT